MGLNILPNDLSILQGGEKRVANKIKQIYEGIDYDAYLYLQPVLKAKRNPDFVLIDEYKGIAIIEVKDWSLGYIENINQIKVRVADGERENPTLTAKTYFNITKDLLKNQGNLRGKNSELKYRLYSNLVFTNMNSDEVMILGPTISQAPINCITSNQITNLSVDDLFSAESEYIKKYDFETIRSVFYPEIKLPNRQMEIWEFSRKNVEENSIIKTLDLEQERFARRVPAGHYMVSGIPGSGKTIILLARAVHLLRENPNWRIILLTYNTSLTNNLKSKLASIQDDLDAMGINSQNIEISTFHSLAKSVANEFFTPPSASKEYWEKLLPLKANDKAQPTYDAILIDEYQDFHESWIKLCLKLCKKYDYKEENTENLFLAGDRLQSIYNPNTQNWKSLGLNVQGRSKLLKSSYRAGSSHINLALNYLMKDETTKKEVETFYEGKNGICCNFDIENNIEFVKGSIKVINDTLKKLHADPNYNPDDILILVLRNDLKNEIYKSLDEDVKVNTIVSKNIQENKTSFTSYHSSKGLETKICILVGVDAVKDRKLLYVGMTRASEKLIIHSFSDKGGPIFKELVNCYNGDMSITSPKKFSIKELRKEHPNAYKKWDEKEELKLKKLYESGKNISEVADDLGRKRGGIRSRLKKIGLVK